RAVIVMDGDLQDPPELIPEMIEKHKEGFEVVYAVRKSRANETIFKKITAYFFYRFFSLMANVKMPLDTGDFRLIDEKVTESLRGIKERSRFVRGLVSWVGFKQAGIPYDREKRKTGKTKYSFFKMLKFSIDGITSFSDFPLKTAAFIGIAISLVSFLVGIYYILIKLFTDRLLQGWATLLVSILFLGGIQLIFLGVIGEYIGRIYEEVKQRPLYIIKEKQGF
ncbi:MAG: glycosyltransferase, partial [Candidatus Omnitrophota bacterium]